MESTSIVLDRPSHHASGLPPPPDAGWAAPAEDRGFGLPAVTAELMATLLSSMRMGALLLGADARVLAANQAGREALSPRHGLVMRNGQLLAVAPDVRRKLGQAIARACQPPYVDGALLLTATDGSGRTCAARVVSMERFAARVERSADGMVLLCVGGARSRPPQAEMLAQTFGLTAAESALMAAIAEGERLRACASRRGVSLATVRAQLRNVFVKTGASTQAELTQIAWSIPGLWLD